MQQAYYLRESRSEQPKSVRFIPMLIGNMLALSGFLATLIGAVLALQTIVAI